MSRVTYSDADLAAAVQQAWNYSEVLRILGTTPHGGAITHFRRRIERLGLDTTHFTGKPRNPGVRLNGPRARRPAETVLVTGTKRVAVALLRRAMTEVGIPLVCAACGLGDMWNGLPIVLEVDHINGNPHDNTPANVRFLCPNCHSQCRDTNRPHKHRNKTTFVCAACNGPKKTRESILCQACRNTGPRPEQHKIVWPDITELQHMVTSTSRVAVANRLGVSETAVRKRLRTHIPSSSNGKTPGC